MDVLAVWDNIEVGMSTAMKQLNVAHAMLLNFFRETVTFDVQDWFTVDQTEAYYADGVSGFRDSDLVAQQIFLQALDSLYPNCDFSKLDTQGWGSLDHLDIIQAGWHGNFYT